MSCVKVSCAALLGIVGMTLPTTPADAVRALTLTSGGVARSDGSRADVGLVLDGCVSFSTGVIAGNGSSKVLVSATANQIAECEEGREESGVVTLARLSAAGKAVLQGKIEVRVPGPCQYLYGSFRTPFRVPGLVVFFGSTVGKLVKRRSDTSCATTDQEFWIGDVSLEAFSEPFEASLA